MMAHNSSNKRKNRRQKGKITANQRTSSTNRRLTTRGSSNIGYELVGGYHGADRKRNIWDQAGYPEQVYPEMLWNMYRRDGIASGIVNLKADETWQDDPIVYDGDEDPERRKNNPTEFEIALDKWADVWDLWGRLQGADKRQMVMRYSGIIIICKEPQAAESTDPLQKLLGPEAIVNLMPVFESEIEVNEGITDENSPYYGQPKYFHFRSEVTGSRNTWIENDKNYHPTRIITFAEGADDGSIYGIPEFESYYNSLLNIEKIETAGGEGFYKNASQRKVYKMDPTLTQGLSTEVIEGITESIDETERNMNGTYVVAGGDLNAIQSQMTDPKEYAQISFNKVAAGSQLPMTVIIGMQTGRLASDEDQTQKNVLIKKRQRKWATPMIKKTLKHLIKYNALPQPDNKITVCWPDITEPSMEAKVNIGKTMMETNKIAVEAQQDSVYSTEHIQTFTGVEVEDVERNELPEGEPIKDEPIKNMSIGNKPRDWWKS